MPTYTPYELTKVDLAALKKADHLSVHYNPKHEVPGLVRALRKAERTEKDPYAEEACYVVPAPVRLWYHWGYKQDHVRCYDLLWVRPTPDCVVYSVLSTLRIGDAIAFEFYSDCHTNDYLAYHGIHADALRLLVYRKEKLHATFTLAVQSCPDNTARMCQGAISPEWSRKAALGPQGLAA